MTSLLTFAVSLFRQDIQERFAGSFLGALWIFIWPMVQLFIYIVIFGKLMGGRFPGSAQVYAYGIYVASGLIGWTLFANVVLRISRIFLEKKHIIGKVGVPLAVFPLFVCLSELLPYAVSTGLLTLIALISGWLPAFQMLVWGLCALYCLLLLAVGIGLICCVCAVFVRDIAEMLAICIQIGFWFTPIVYVPSVLPQWMQSVIQINPMLHVISVFQNLFVLGQPPSLAAMTYVAVMAHGLFLLALWIMRRLEKEIRDVL